VQAKAKTEPLVAKTVEDLRRGKQDMYRDIVLMREGLQGAYVIVVLVRYKYRVELVDINADALERCAERLCAPARVDKYLRAARLDKDRVAL
jgi:hypothetical protein